MITDEAPLDPQRPIIDPHHHLWDRLPDLPALQIRDRFLLPDFLEVIGRSGHNITHTVFVECNAMYRQDGPPEMKPIGETEFVNGIAAISASGECGTPRIAHRIVGCADLRLGERVAPVLEAHCAAAGARLRGIRAATAFSEAGMFGYACDESARRVLLDDNFHDGARVLAKMGLSLDVWCFHTQLRQLGALADAVPDLTVILDHVGTPERLGIYQGREAQAFREWRTLIGELAHRSNVLVKLGGLGMDLSRPVDSQQGPAPSEALAALWRPLFETCIEVFTPQRCMFESNFPPDRAAGSYGATWNAFKRIARNYSEAEKDQLFRRTAATAYGIALGDPGEVR